MPHWTVWQKGQVKPMLLLMAEILCTSSSYHRVQPWARFSLFDSEIGAQNDLDLQIQGPDPSFPFVCSSGSGTSEEQCDLVNPAPGLYAAFVIDFASDPGDTAYTLWNFNLDGTNAGNSTISAPASATIGTTGNITIDWFGPQWNRQSVRGS